jgi:translocation and assembly module TamB
MAEPVKTRRTRARLWIMTAIGVVFLGVILALVWYLRSPQFGDFVRRKVIASLKDATGGRVELGSFSWSLAKLQFQADNLTIHGLEGPDQLPYAHADRINLRVRILSFVQTRISLEYLGLEHPVIHLIVHPDGTTNVPGPKAMQSNSAAVQQLVDLAVARVDLRNGMLLVNDLEIPLDFTADDIAATVTYSHIDRRYDGSIQVGKMDLKYQDFRNVAARGEMEFILWHDTAQIKSLKLTSEKSLLEASGKVTNFDNPKVEFTYHSVVDGAQLGAVTRTYQLRGGTLSLNGSGTYAQTGYGTRGKLAVRGLDYLDAGETIRNANATTDFVLENNRLVLTKMAARLLGGEVTGDAEIKNLMSSASTGVATTQTGSAPKAKRPPASKGVVVGSQASEMPAIVGPGPQQGSARLRVNGLSLTELARMISTRGLLVDKLNPVGRVEGTIELAWKRSLAEADANLSLDAVPPAQPAANELPVTATVRGRYSLRTQIMDFSALNLATRQTHLSASGALGSRSAALKVDLKATSLAEFQTFLSAMGNSPVPVELAGEAEFNGRLEGRLRELQIAGHVQASNFTYVYTPRAQNAPQPVAHPAQRKSIFHSASVPAPQATPPAAPARRIHIDQFSADVQYSPSGVALHNATIQEGNARIALDGTATLNKGNFTENSAFQVHAAMHDADVAALQRTMGLNYPISGTLNFTVQAAGTEANPNGKGQFSLTSAQAYGRPIKSLAANIVFANHEAQLHDIRLLAARGTVAGSASYNLSNKVIALDLSGEGIDLAEIPELQTERLQTRGVAQFTAKGSGTLEEPVINAHLQISKMVLNGDAIGGLTADAVTHGRQLKLSARSDFPKATFAVDGNIELRGDMPANLAMQFAHLDIDPFLRAEIKGRITGHSSIAGHASVNGPLKQPQLLNGAFKIDAFSVEVERIPIASDGAIELSLANQVLSVQRCSLVSGDSRFTLSGSAQLAGEHAVDLHADGNVDLKLAHILDPDIGSYGAIKLNLAVNGSMSKPLIAGRIDIEHGGVSMIDVPSGLGDINGSFIFNQDRLEVDHLTAHMGGGLVTFAGFVTYGRTIGFNLTANGTEIRFRYAGISVTSDQRLRLMGTLQNASLNGDVTVTRFAQIPSTDLKFAVAQAGQPARIPDPGSPLNNLHLDVRILSAPELTVQTSLAKLSGDVDLRLRGTAARPVLLGRINIAEGNIKLGGAKYHLERGDIAFTDPIRIDPVLDVQATTRVRDYDITIGLHGTLEKLNTTYRSDPPLSSEDIVALLAFGRTQQENAMGTTPSSGFAETASGALMSEAINQTVNNRVSKLFGVSSIRINPSVGGPDNNPNARLTIEQQVSNNVTFTYITNLAQSAQQVIQFEYNINSEYTIEGIRDENGVVSLDVLIRKRKR